MKRIDIHEQKNIVGGKLTCTACGRTWRTRLGYLFTAALHNLTHLVEGKWFKIV